MDQQVQTAPNEEQTLWEGHASQVVNLPVFILCGLGAGALVGAAALVQKANPSLSLGLAGAAIIPCLIAVGKWLQNQCRTYQVTTERIHLRQGVLSRKTDALELYRVKDYLLVEPFSLRMFGLGNLVLTTTDDANPKVTIHAVPDVQSLRDQIRKHVEICRTRKGVRIAELE